MSKFLSNFVFQKNFVCRLVTTGTKAKREIVQAKICVERPSRYSTGKNIKNIMEMVVENAFATIRDTR